jgi:hypothetical protein
VKQRAKRLLILWHLLSLDAPTVATLWTWYIARVSGLELSLSPLAAMAASVWVLYAADRLLDARSQEEHLEERHCFHNLHRRGFLIGIAVASIMLAILLPRLPMAAIRLYLVLGGLVFGYFVAIHVMRGAHRMPKEIVVGVCFAAAVFIPTVSRAPVLRGPLLLPALLFAGACSLNCLFIYEWEHEAGIATQAPHPLTAVALSHLVTLACAVAVACLVLALFDHSAPWKISAAVSLSAIALIGLHRSRSRYCGITLRSMADVSLLTPLLFAVLT